MLRLLLQSKTTVMYTLVVLGCLGVVAWGAIAQAQSSTLRDRIYAQVSADPASESLTQQELDELVDGLTREAEEANITVNDTVSATTVQQDGADLIAGGVVSCFDYYSFGSVQAYFDPSVSSVVSGTPVTFTGEIVNNNAYPVVEGALYVKVFRLRDNAQEKNVNGPHVVDQFFVKQDIAIPANGAVPLAFSWNVPSYAMSGEYQIAAFFTTSKKFNLLGLSFTDDVVGNSARFTVSAERIEGVYFDKDQVTVNEDSYYFAAFPPEIPAGETANVQAYVTNETDEDVQVPVVWRLHAWDAQRRENVITEQEVRVAVKAGGRSPVTFTTQDAKHAVYLLEGTARWRDTESFINVRFAREGINHLRLNFPSVTSYPLVAGQPTTLFSCFHNENAEVLQGKIELELVDSRGRTIENYEYEGQVGGDMMAVAKQFTPQRNYDRFTLKARLYQNGDLVEQVEVPYDCEAIVPTSCSLEGDDFDLGAGLLGGFGGTAAGVLLAALLAIGALWVWWRHGSTPAEPMNPPPATGM